MLFLEKARLPLCKMPFFSQISRPGDGTTLGLVANRLSTQRRLVSSTRAELIIELGRLHINLPSKIQKVSR